jgi:hypothetical protein
MQTITSMNHFDFNSKYRTDILNGSNFRKRNGEQMYNYLVIGRENSYCL